MSVEFIRIVMQIVMGDLILAVGGYAVGVGAYALVKLALRKWAGRGKLARFLFVAIALVVGLACAWLWHDLLEAVANWYVKPLAPSLQLY